MKTNGVQYSTPDGGRAISLATARVSHHTRLISRGVARQPKCAVVTSITSPSGLKYSAQAL